MNKKYRVFKRSCTSFTHLSRRGTTLRTGLTYAEAQQFCRNFNADRTSAQVKAGTKAEFTEQ